MNKKQYNRKKFIYITALVFIVLFSVGYSALSQVLNIGGSTRYNKKYPVRVTGIQLQGVTNSGTEQFNPNYTYNTTTTGVDLPNLNSTVTYTVTVRNYGSEDKGINLNITNNSNTDITYETSNMPTNNVIPANSTVTFNVTIKYNTSTLPGTTTDTMVITYTFGNIGAMLKTGKEVNAKMKKFVNTNATYNTQDTTITNIARYAETPNSTYLTDTYKVSTDEYITPIYMWYDSTNTTIYWYSEAINVYYNPNSSNFFSNLRAINSITCMNDISSEYVTTMYYMFSYTGYSSTSFTLDLGEKFDTSNVTTMSYMFYNTGYSSTSFTLDLGNKFDTSNVTNMQSMFESTGYSSTVFTLDLGDKFDTSKVTYMQSMFESTGRNSTVFTLDLEDKFDTSNVTNMEAMFYSTGYRSTVFTLDLGDKFDTSNVTTMYQMFFYTGRNGPVFTLDLGDKFDTSNVTTMYQMFHSTGYNSTVFTLDLGDKFDTSNVTTMSYMFQSTGYSSTVFTLNLGDKFDTSNVINMGSVFYSTGRSSTVFTLDLGDKFDTSNVTIMSYMFYDTGYSSTIFTLDLGDKFDTSNVTNMSSMFYYSGYSSTVFTLDLGNKFDTSNVTNMSYMFYYIGYSNTSFTLDLGDKFGTSNVTDMSYMFRNSRYLKTIYAPTTFVTTAVTNSTDMFNGCTNLVGGQGTIYNSSYIDKTYAHIDGGTSNPGYFTARTTATFKSGQEVNAKMKQFVNSSATYEDGDSTITNIVRYTGTPNIGNLTTSNIVSTSDSQETIYMWYDSSNTTIYWYTPATLVYYNSDSSYFYSGLSSINQISNLDDINSIYATTMERMFFNTGQGSSTFVLNLGNKFNTKNVTNMFAMFAGAGCNSSSFTLDLGNKFNTSNVTNMSNMFASVGVNSNYFVLDLGDYFDTSKVTDMSYMFGYTGYYDYSFTLDLGDKFDTSSVTDMSYMFNYAAPFSSLFTLDLGDKFDTSNVTNMEFMFNWTGRGSSFTLDLGDNFDTSNVTNMYGMFGYFGPDDPNFVIDLGDKFDTSNVTNMSNMFISSSSSVFDLGNNFDTSNVTNMSNMFAYNGNLTTIYAPTSFVTIYVTNSTGMFDSCSNLVGGLGTVYNSSHIDKAYAHIDGGTSNPGYFTLTGTRMATIYYNTNTSSGSVTVATATTSCVAQNGSNSCTITVPSEVSSSMGKYNSPYKGLSDSTGNMNDTLSISSDTSLYANYSKQVMNYYYDSDYTSRILYRNEYFTSTSDMESRIATSNNSTTNYSTANGPGGSTWTGLSTGQDVTAEFGSVQDAANSNTANLYSVYTFTVNYDVGSNVSSVGESSGSCSVTTGSTSCSVTLPSITPDSGYTSVGWNTSSGATTGDGESTTYTLSSNGDTLYGNAIKYYTCPTSRTPATYNYGTYQTSRYGSYQSACQSRSGANSECGTTTVCGSQYSAYECHVSWRADCGEVGPLWNEEKQWYYYCGYSNQTINRTCTSYRCPNSVATWNYTYGEPQLQPYGDYQDQCT